MSADYTVSVPSIVLLLPILLLVAWAHFTACAYLLRKIDPWIMRKIQERMERKIQAVQHRKVDRP